MRSGSRSFVASLEEQRPGGDSLSGRIVARSELAYATREAMLALLAAHFAGVDRDAFECDLAEKTCAILLEDAAGRLRGFSTLLAYESAAAERATIIFSGDTIVDRQWWGSPALPRTWIRAVRTLAAGANGRDVYWFLITSGFRTYRFLPVFFKSFYPRHDLPGPCPLLDAIARERFGRAYDPATGIVHLPRPQRLSPELLELPAGRTLDPHVACFLERNPRHADGDELACLARIHDDNLTPAGRRMARGIEER